MNLLALNLRILVNPPLQDLELDRNGLIGHDIRSRRDRNLSKI